MPSLACELAIFIRPYALSLSPGAGLGPEGPLHAARAAALLRGLRGRGGAAAAEPPSRRPGFRRGGN